MKHGNKRLLYVFGTVMYRDVFGESHYTKICQMILWMVDGTATTRNYGNYNESDQRRGPHPPPSGRPGP